MLGTSVRIGSLLLFTLSTTAWAQTVWIVDDDGGAGVDFTSLPAAVAAAGEGDVVLVRDGLYAEFQIAGKSLSVIAEAGQRPIVSELVVGQSLGSSVVRVLNLAPGQEVYLRGLELGGTYFQSFSRTPYITLSNNQGEVWIEDVVVGDGVSSFVGFTGLLATDCAGVNVARSNLSPPTIADPDQSYGHAVHAVDTNLTLWDSTLLGAPGWSFLSARNGGDGVRVSGGTVFVSGCRIAGGEGGSTTSSNAFGGDGGDGVNVDGGALVRMRDCTLAGGAAGSGPLGPGAPGQASNVVSGTLIPIVGATRTLEITSPARAGIDSITETFTGQSGDLVYLLWSYTGQIPGFYLSLEHGSFVIDITTLDGVAIGSIGATGTLVNTIPPLALTGDVFNLACQAAFLDGGGGGFYISGPSLLTLVAGTF